MAPRPLKRRAVFTAGRHQAYPRQGPGCGVGHRGVGVWARAQGSRHCGVGRTRWTL